jgi:hypothetical protein
MFDFLFETNQEQQQLLAMKHGMVPAGMPKINSTPDFESSKMQLHPVGFL